MIHAWRLTRRRHAMAASEAFNGVGAQRTGGRWNRIGTRAAYASSTRSLAALEYLAHVDPDELPDDLVFAGVAIRDADVEQGDPPSGWDTLDSFAALSYGESWLRSAGSLALAIPSAVVNAECNFVINPSHGRAGRLTFAAELEAFTFDARLLRNQSPASVREGALAPSTTSRARV